ncbi:hypothetical protein, variant [Verruconis gallopava]|uniref:UBL3-like ubiquitin domain-containing protein n=1 Tax=Verruconis gallopava TaxID=253628 RepID=A0A0D2B6Z0_9PEZI|nr:hypothetical protein, variant [Verruconis gallopava]KIW06979.1 hypothetical protein, variant [Verruconis gallopava]
MSVLVMTKPESNEMAALPPAEPALPPVAHTAAASTPMPSASSQHATPSLSHAPSRSQPPTTASSRPAPLEEDITAVATTNGESEAGPSATMERKESEAIGPATDENNIPKSAGDTESGPTVLITLLLTTGKRHPYKIDARYLRKRNVSVEENNPWNLPVQTLKELILRDWREGESSRVNASVR